MQTWDPTYNLELKPAQKDITIASNPPGAKIFFDNKELVPRRQTIPNVDFPFDDDANEYQKHEIRAEKAGYDPVKKSISWDDGRAGLSGRSRAADQDGADHHRSGRARRYCSMVKS